jgi:shikimate kinase
VPGRHVVLVGLPGSGKSTVGQIAASLLGATFIDLDRLIESRCGRTIERIMAEQGEAGFRMLEAEAAADVLGGPAAVVAPGGGFFEDPASRQSALDTGYVVYLQVSPSVAARRLKDTADRPLLKGYDITLRLAQLLQRREAAYLQAHAKVSTDSLSASQVADRVAVLARSGGGW